MFEEEAHHSSKVAKLTEDLLLAETRIAELQTELSLSNEHQLEVNKAIKQLQTQIEADQAQIKLYKSQFSSQESKITAFQQRISELEEQLLNQIRQASRAISDIQLKISESPKNDQGSEKQALEEVLSTCCQNKMVTEEEKDLLVSVQDPSFDQGQLDSKGIRKLRDLLLRVLPHLSPHDHLFFHKLLTC